jgi:lipoyl-dependent peroxiredoxin subunit C
MLTMPAPMEDERTAGGDRMLTVGDAIPEFRLPALAGPLGRPWHLDSACLRGRWLALMYWPRVSSLQSVAGLAELVRIFSALTKRDTQFVAACGGVEADRHVLPASRTTTETSFPVVVDVRGTLAVSLGIERTLQAGGRATFVADPTGVVRWAGATDLSLLDGLREAAAMVAALAGRPAVESHASSAPPARTASRRLLIRACAWCRRVKDDEGWHTPEAFIRRRTGHELTHGICTECLEEQSGP